MRIVTWPLPTLKLPPAKALKPPSTLGNHRPAPKRTALQLLVFVTKLIVLEQYATVSAAVCFLLWVQI